MEIQTSNHVSLTSISRLLGQAGVKEVPGFAPLPGRAFHPPGYSTHVKLSQEPWRSDGSGRKRNSKKKMG